MRHTAARTSSLSLPDSRLIFRRMRRFTLILAIAFGVATAAHAVEGHVFKVLPQYLDEKGRESLTPSLYDRDAYQADLRQHPGKRSALRFAVQWKISRPKAETRKLRVELRGTTQGDVPGQTTLELPLERHAFSHWDYVVMSPDKYKSFGEVTAWRVTLWDGDQLLDEQKSFLW